MLLQELGSELATWKALNACRSVGVILGWVLISIRPNTDLLYKHIKRLGVYRPDQLLAAAPDTAGVLKM